MREVKHVSIGLRQSILRFKAYKFQCYRCKRYFNQRFPGSLKHQRASEALRQQVVLSAYPRGIAESLEC